MSEYGCSDARRLLRLERSLADIVGKVSRLHEDVLGALKEHGVILYNFGTYFDVQPCGGEKAGCGDGCDGIATCETCSKKTLHLIGSGHCSTCEGGSA